MRGDGGEGGDKNTNVELSSSEQEPIMCRLCKSYGWHYRQDPIADKLQIDTCVVCKGEGMLHAADVDEWTFADLDDEPLGAGAMGNKPKQRVYVHPNAKWQTWVDEEDGRGYLWSELKMPKKGTRRKRLQR
tara:strand:- start:2708 stop:3100 length:393 start_codon:yes stop_codon:yes gene_type:complete